MEMDADPFPRMVNMVSTSLKRSQSQKNLCQCCRQDIEVEDHAIAKGKIKVNVQPGRIRKVPYTRDVVRKEDQHSVFDRVTYPKKKPTRKKSLKLRFKEGDPIVGTLGQPSGKFNYYVVYARPPHLGIDVKNFIPTRQNSSSESSPNDDMPRPS